MNYGMLFTFNIALPIILTWFLLDITRKASIKLKLFAVPNERSSHDKIIPTTGGIALSISWLLITFLFIASNDMYSSTELFLYILGGVIMTIVGFYDDIKEMRSSFKLIMQIFVFFIISFADNSLINSLHGLFGIYELSYIQSILFSLFVFVVIINSINLIDGIDGLSSTITLFYLTITSFYCFVNDYYFSGLLLSFCSSLIVFIFFNYSKSKKIFLGDTGSLGLGFTVALITLGWLNSNHQLANTLPLNHSLFLVLMLSYPLLDVIRVFTIRTLRGKSFMTADRNHIHHKLIDIGFTHKKAVLIILISKLLLIIFNIIFISELDIHIQILINAALITGLLLFLYKTPNKN
tara:strand:- start:12 stop:1064 length:1053 start_codon:yes stop_codon:yes gene_type:complete